VPIDNPKKLPQAYVCYGPPGSGVSSILETLCASTKMRVKLVPYLGPDSIPAIEHALEFHEKVFVDIDGGVILPSDIQALVEGCIIYYQRGGIIRVHTPLEEIVKRNRFRDEPVLDTDVVAWERDIHDVVMLIRAHSLTHYGVKNDDLAHAAQVLAQRVGIRS